MTQTALLITHAADEKDDRASSWLARQGYDLRWICPPDGDPLPEIDESIAATVIYGGRYDVDQQKRYPFLKDELAFIDEALAKGVPTLGLCLGAQLMAHALGQRVYGHPEGKAEYGYYAIRPTPAGEALFGAGLTVLQSHWHGWYATPAGSVTLARSELFPQQAFRYGSSAYALQFHPEASFATMSRWVDRRGDRNGLPGAFPAERQRADHAVHDAALGIWFEGLLQGWLAGSAARQAAE